MRVEIRMPKVAYESETASLACWLKAAGEAVTLGDAIAEVETEKTNLDLCSPATGILGEILVEAQREVPVDSVIGYVEDGS